MELENLIPELEDLCLETGEFIRKNFRKITGDDVISKEKNSLVSFVDREAEKMITTKLKTLLPEAGFHTEEDSVVNSESSLQWIVDPLDGTTNFISGIPHFCISIALKEHEEITMGMVYNVMENDIYLGLKGKGAWLNDKAIRVAEYSQLDEAIIATGFPYDKEKIDEKVIELLVHFVVDARALRRLGSAALDLCFVAQGTFHLYYERFLNAWDIAAGALIVREAGGKVCDFNGGSDYLERGEMIAFCPGMENEVEFMKF